MNKKLKIAIIGSRGYPYVYSGYETLVKEISERIVSRGHQVRVYCHSSLYKEKPKFLNGIELVYTPSIETKFLSQFTNSFFSFIHVCFSNFDIVLVVNSSNGPFGILTKIFNKKTFINVDGLEWLRPKWKGLGSIYFKIASFLATKLFDFIITDSNNMKIIYENKFNIDSTVIAYGDNPLNKYKSEIMSKLKISKYGYFLVVGRMIADNNSLEIIKGFLKSNSSKKILVVGDVPFDDNYSRRIKKIKNEKLILTGYIRCENDLNILYKNCFGYIHGHEFGGTNPTMIKALYADCQILSLDTIFNREMLMQRQVVFFKKENISNKIQIFERTIQRLRKKNINYKIPKIYNWNFITNQYLDLFKQII